MPNAPKPGTVQITMRISEELAARAEQAAAKLRKANPGIPIARTDAIRMILEKHLPPLEDAAAPSAPSAKPPPVKPAPEKP